MTEDRAVTPRLGLPPLLVALVASVLLHFAPVLASLVELPNWRWWQDNDVVSRKAGGELAKVSLAAQAAPGAKSRPGVPTVYLVVPATAVVATEPPPSPPPVKPKPRRKAPAAAAATELADAAVPPAPREEDDPFATLDLPEPQVPATPPITTSVAMPVEEEVDMAAEPAQPPPAGLRFPPRISARYKGSYFGFNVAVEERWRVDGPRYRIERTASKFGYQARLISQGQLSTSGLKPERYSFYLNSKDAPKNFAEFTGNSIRYGKPSDRKETGLTALPQDVLSFAYHLALSYDGKQLLPMQITTGSSVYEVNIGINAEEVIRTPAGEIRTVHLKGSRKHLDGRSQDGYELWLAPDYRNYPVKLRGPDSSGRVMELVLMALNFDGETVLGKDAPTLAEENSPAALPSELLQKHGADVAMPAATTP